MVEISKRMVSGRGKERESSLSMDQIRGGKILSPGGVYSGRQRGPTMHFDKHVTIHFDSLSFFKSSTQEVYTHNQKGRKDKKIKEKG